MCNISGEKSRLQVKSYYKDIITCAISSYDYMEYGAAVATEGTMPWHWSFFSTHENREMVLHRLYCILSVYEKDSLA